mmetsp:Transcript_73271/g.85113  ORF Transcript_73271/g.85113 Transcript_73271/m.85113 type:complete len:520 (-) Transcript_73271:59-1618(-)
MWEVKSIPEMQQWFDLTIADLRRKYDTSAGHYLPQHVVEPSLCVAAMVLTLFVAVDVVRSPSNNNEDDAQAYRDDLHRHRDSATRLDLSSASSVDSLVRHASTAVRDFLPKRFQPALRRWRHRGGEFHNTSLEHIARLTSDVAQARIALESARHDRRAVNRLSSVVESRGGLPWYATRRHVEPNVRKNDFGTIMAAVDQHFFRWVSADHVESIHTNSTYTTNTLDKFRYQLKNFAPLSHRFSVPQWNGLSLAAQRKLGAVNPRGFLIGISSVNRATNYLVSTLVSFLTAMPTTEERRLVHIVVLNANWPPSAHEDITAVRMQFANEIETGMLEIIELPHPHPQLKNPEELHQRWGDDLSRVQWRSKQVLDVAYLMDYCANHSMQYSYFLMMEDDIIASKHFAKRLRSWVDQKMLRNTEWSMLSFYNPWPVVDMQQLPPKNFYGVIGQLFRTHDLPVIVEFLRLNFDESPLDWLFVDYLKKFGGSIVVHTPSLFQHQGSISSLPGKEQQGRSVDFVDAET